jgi:hypothetical protein
MKSGVLMASILPSFGMRSATALSCAPPVGISPSALDSASHVSHLNLNASMVVFAAIVPSENRDVSKRKMTPSPVENLLLVML